MIVFNKSVFSLFIFNLIISNFCYSMGPNRMLVLDEKANTQLPGYFRIIDSMAGSAQFSEESLNEAIKKLSTPILVVDLRRESHGFINGQPISWYANANQSNMGLSLQAINQDEIAKLNEIKKNPTVIVFKILKKENGIIKKSRSFILRVKETYTEKNLVEKLGLRYLRIAVSDHHRPSDKSVDDFVTLVNNLPKNTTLYFHCRGGRGRTTTFMVLLDILKNGNKLSLEEIIHRQISIGGTDLLMISNEEKDHWKREAANTRTKFIRDFYQYRNSKHYPIIPWSLWKVDN